MRIFTILAAILLMLILGCAKKEEPYPLPPPVQEPAPNSFVVPPPAPGPPDTVKAPGQTHRPKRKLPI